MAQLTTMMGGPSAKEDDSSDDEPEFQQLKIIVVGDGAVGKTSLIQRFCNDHFSTSYKQTIGVDFLVKRITFPGSSGSANGAVNTSNGSNSNNPLDVSNTGPTDTNGTGAGNESYGPTTCCCQIWDIGGQSIGGKMIGSYIHNSDAILICYDITSHQSFDNVNDWLDLVKKHAGERKIKRGNAGTTTNSTTEGEEPLIALVGTKSDLNHLRAVKAVRHQQVCDREGLRGSYFVSSKIGDGIEAMFKQIAADLCDIQLTTAQETAFQKPVTAEIINHQRHDPAHPEPLTPPTINQKEDKKKCSIM